MALPGNLTLTSVLRFPPLTRHFTWRHIVIRSSASGDLIPTGTAPEGLGLLTILRFFIRNLGWIILGGVLGLAAAFAYCKVAAPSYASDSEIMVMRKVGVTADNDAAGEVSLSEEVLATHLQLIRSPRVVSKSLKATGLDQATSVQDALEDDLTPTDYVIENLQTHKGGEGSGRTAQVLHLRFRHSDPDDCQAILLALLDGYRNFLTESAAHRQQEAMTLAVKKRDESARAVAASEAEQKDLRQKSPGLWKGDESVSGPRQSAEAFEAELAKLKIEQADLEVRLAGIKKLVPEKPTMATWKQLLPLVEQEHFDRLVSMMTVGNTDNEHDYSMKAEYGQILSLRVERTKLLTRFDEAHPRVKQVDNAIREIERFLNQRGDTAVASVDPETVVRSYVTFLQTRLEQVRQKRLNTQEFLTEAVREAKANIEYELSEKTLIEQLTQQRLTLAEHQKLVDDLELASKSEGFVIETIAPPKHGEQVSPKPMLFLPLGLILGSGLATALVFLRDDTLNFRDFQGFDDNGDGGESGRRVADSRRELTNVTVATRVSRPKKRAGSIPHS